MKRCVRKELMKREFTNLIEIVIHTFATDLFRSKERNYKIIPET